MRYKPRRYLSIIVTLSFLLTIMLGGVQAAFAQPSDIQGHWAQEQIGKWLDKGLAGGYPDGTFKPDRTISRAEFVALANRAFKFEATAEISFSDVAATAWYAGEISKASAAGYVSGYEDGTFRPGNNISRQEAAAMLVRILGLDAPDINVLDRFADAAAIPAWSRGAINSAVAAGLMSGYPDQTFRPSQAITRAEAVVTLDRALSYVPVEEPEPVESAVEGVVSFNGKPVSDATILVFAAGSYEILAETETNNRGYFKVELEPGAYDITAAGDDGVACEGDIEVFENKVTTVDLALEEAAEISGELKDKNDRAVKKATMLFTTNPTFATVSDNNGQFTALVLPNRTYTVRAYEPGEEDEEPEIVARELVVGKAGRHSIGTLNAPFSVSVSLGGGGGGGAPSVQTTATVANKDQLNAALANSNIKTIIFSSNITADINATRLVDLNFAGYQLDGSVNITSNAAGSILISGSATPAITGNLTVVTPNATVTNRANIGGTVIIKAVAKRTWNEEADGNKLDVQVEDGKINIKGKADSVTVTQGGAGLQITVERGGKVEVFTVAAEANININGSVSNVTINAPASITISPEGNVAKAGINAPVTVIGAYKIQAAEITAVGVVLDKPPQEYSSDKRLIIGGEEKNPKAAKPVADPPAGTVPAGTEVTLTTKTEGAKIYYTTDDSDYEDGGWTEYTGEIELTADTTIKAIAVVGEGWDNSNILTASYRVVSGAISNILEAVFEVVPAS